MPDLAEPLLPPALRLGALVVVPAAFLLSLLVAAAIVGAWLRRPIPAAWTERARLATSVRLTLMLVTLCFALAGGIFAWHLASPLLGTSRAWLGLATGVAAFAGADLVRLGLERRLRGEAIPALGWYAWKALWLAIFGAQLVPVLVGGVLAGDRFDRRAVLVVAATMAIVLALGTGALWLVLAALGLVRRASERVCAAVERASARTGVRPKAVWTIPTLGVPFANAFALPMLRRIAFTADAVRWLDDDELEAIAAHELGHVSEPASVIAARLARSAIYLPLVLLRPLIGVFGPAAALLLPLVFVVGVRLSARLARRMEERADAIAHGRGRGGRHPPHDDEVSPAYARGLEKLYARNLVPAVMAGKRRVHPDLWDRMVAAGATPAYPKPAPPRTKGALLVGVTAGFLGALALGGFDAWVGATLERRAASLVAAEARARLDEGAVVEAFRLYDRARQLDGRAVYSAAMALCEARFDACLNAAEDLAAVRRTGADPELAPMLSEADRALADCWTRRATSEGPIPLAPDEEE